MRVAVLVSGRGSNLRALCEAIDRGDCAVEVVGVVADRKKCDALAFASDRGVPTFVVRPRDHEGREAWDEALAETVRGLEPELVVFAGFMRVVGASMIASFEDRMINVHPSLLPAFPGMDAPGQAIAAGVRVAGCTVHRVDAGVDSGAILAQAVLPVHPEDDPASLHARIQRLEHALLPRVVDALARGEPGAIALFEKGEAPHP